MGVTTTADLTRQQISYSPTNLTTPGPVNQGSATPSPFNPTINQGATTPTLSNPDINQGETTPSITNPEIIQGSTEPLKNLNAVTQGSTDPVLANYEINQGKTTPNLINTNIRQGETTPTPTNPIIEQGATTPSLTNYNIRQGETTPNLPDANIQQGSTDPALTNYNIQQGATTPVLTDYNIRQGQTTPSLTNYDINQGETTPTPSNPNIRQGQTTPSLTNYQISQGETTPVLTDYNIRQGETTPNLPNVNIVQGATTPVMPNINIQQGATTPTLTNYNIEQGATTPTLPNTNIQQGSTTPSLPNTNIQQGSTTPVLTNPNIQQGSATPTIVNTAINQGSTTPVLTNPNIQQGSTTPNISNTNIQQGSTTPVLPNINIQQGSTTPSISNPSIQQGSTTPTLTNYNIEQGETTPSLTNYTINQGETTPELTNYNIEQGETTPALTNPNIQQGETTPGLTNPNIEQGETTPSLTDYNIQQGSTTPTLTNYNIQQGQTTPTLTNYNIEQGETTPTLTNPNIEQGETTPELTNYNIQQGSTTPTLTNYDIEQGETTPTPSNPNIQQGETTPTLTNYDIEQGETTPFYPVPTIYQGETTPTPPNTNIVQGETTPVLTNYNIDQGSVKIKPNNTVINIFQGATTPILTNYNINQGAGSVVVYRPGPGLNNSIEFGENQKPLLATSPLFSQTVPSTAPIVGGASLASLVTGGITAATGNTVGAQVVSIATYLGALPLSLYRRPDGLLLIGAQVAEVAFSHFMTRKYRLFDSDFASSSTLNLERFNKTGQQQILNDSDYDSRTTDLSAKTNENISTSAFFYPTWKTDTIFYINKFQFRTKGPGVPNVNYDLQKTPIGNSYSLFNNDFNTFNKVGTVAHVYRPDNKFLSDNNVSTLTVVGREIARQNNPDPGLFNGPTTFFAPPPAGAKPPVDSPYETRAENLSTPMNSQKGILADHRPSDEKSNVWAAGINSAFASATLTYNAISQRAKDSIEGGSLRPLQIPGSVNFSTDKKGVLYGYKPYNLMKIADVDPTNTDAETNEPIDPIYSDAGLTTTDNKDFVKLLFKDKRGGGLGTLQFRAYIDQFSDKFSHNWNDINYVGRPNSLKIFNNVTRDVNISFMVPALSRNEMKFIYTKLERLAKMALPTGVGVMIAPMVEITVGDWFIGETCNIISLDFDIDPEHTWEINIEEDLKTVGELPHIVKVSVGLNVIGNTVMNNSYKIFGTNITS